MRKNAIAILTGTLALLALCSCNREAEMNAFAQDSTIRIQVGGTVQFQYDPLTCQISTSRSRKTFRAYSDNMSDFFSAEFNLIPETEGQILTADISWTTETDIMSRKKLTLEVQRIEGDKIVLWSKSGHIGLCISALE